VRPVNLIPPEERREKAPIRTGPIAYVLIGALALALGAVTMMVLTNNKISDKKSEISQLQAQETAAKAEAQRYSAFASFSQVEKSRSATVKSLADSRFDWPRVMRELARVIPGDVWLINLTGTVSPQVSAPSSSSPSSGSTAAIDMSSITGPSLVISGCARSQDAVARFLATLRDIDGVTRVALANSDLPDESTLSGASGSGSSSQDCQTRAFIAKFTVVAAFDAVPAPQVPGASPSPTTPAPSTVAPTPTTPASSTTATSGGE
jgi:Tfp pilus assembly protein PilN